MTNITENDFGFKPLFYLLNLNRNELSSIAVEKISDTEFEGITFKEWNTGWSMNPTKIGRGFIALSKFDFTEQFQEAKEHASIPQSDNIIRTYDGANLDE